MKLLFIVNPGSGSNTTDYPSEIETYFRDSGHEAGIYQLPEGFSHGDIRNKIDTSNADTVVAVGGDGTVKLVAECLLGKGRPLGIIPAGSANGLAKELGIPTDLPAALELCVTGRQHPVHLTRVNEHLCIHLSDIGFNAFVVKRFEDEKKRGMWGYMRAAFKTLMNAPYLDVDLLVDGRQIRRRAAMVVIANGTRYGSGAVINPDGRIDDSLFEIVIVRRISFSEIFKMMVTHRPYDPEKTELFQTANAEIRSGKKAHFQVDGEYLGKTHYLKATLETQELKVLMPE